jgi:hypothetical protein
VAQYERDEPHESANEGSQAAMKRKQPVRKRSKAPFE